VVIILHFYLVLGQSDLSILFDSQSFPSTPIQSIQPTPPKSILRPMNEAPIEQYSDYKKDLMNMFDEEEKTKPYVEPLKNTNPHFDELEAYYSKLSNDKYSFDPVPTATTNDFKTDLLNDAKSNLNPEIVYGNIMAFEDFDSNFASL
jgi:hypothetical protein